MSTPPDYDIGVYSNSYVSRLEDTADSLQERVEDLLRFNTRLQDQVDNLVGLEAANDYLLRQLDEVQADRVSALRKAKDLETSLGILQQKVSNLDAVSDKEALRIQDLENTVSAFSSERVQLVAEIRSLRDQLATQRDVAASRDHWKALVIVRDRELAEVKGHRTNLQGYTSRQAQIIQNLEMALEDRGKQNRILDGLVTELTEEVDDLKFDVACLETENERLLTLSATDAVQILKLNEVIEDLADDLEELDQVRKVASGVVEHIDEVLASNTSRNYRLALAEAADELEKVINGDE